MQPNRIILLTACVNPDGMPFTAVIDSSIRVREYENALGYYLKETDCPIVIVDNSGYSFGSFAATCPDRIEALHFDGNGFDKELGKGYGEGLIIEYALNHSRFINSQQPVIIYKITGRHLVCNVSSLFHSTSFGESLSHKAVFAVLKENEKEAVSDVFSGPVSFFQDLTHYLQECNDSMGCYFEHKLFECIIRSIEEKRIRFFHFPLPIIQHGVSGSTGKPLKQIGSRSKYTLKYLLYLLKINKLIDRYNARFR